MEQLSLPWPVVLASASPRRRELLQRVVADFEVAPADIDEDAVTDPDPIRLATKLAIAKAEVGFSNRADALVIGADTIVVLDNEVYNKPQNAAEARAMLTALSGRTHLVVTGIAVIWPGGSVSAADSSRVSFRPLTESVIDGYVATGEPMDKAGAYAIQGGGADFVCRLDGDEQTVIGLPLTLLLQLLGRITNGTTPRQARPSRPNG